MKTQRSDFFITGGTLPLDAVSYVERQADHELLAALQSGQFSYVLTPRQMGKSSLMVRTAAKLREAGYRVAVIDLSAIGQNLSPAQWYRGMLTLLGQQLGSEAELESCWRALHELGPVQRLFECLRRSALPADEAPLVIFVDEIDAVRSLPFRADEFLAAIRECHNRRTQEPDLERLTFCLLGVAAPPDLIQDTRSTPFNVSRRIELQDFSRQEAAVLAVGIELGPVGVATRTAAEAERFLSRVLHWTEGHPYLTQRLCQAVAARAAAVADVDALCAELFFTPGAREGDDNLAFIRERLVRPESGCAEEEVASLLHLYSRVQRGARVRDAETDRYVSLLRLSGVVRSEQGWLRLRNRIYARVFDRRWIAAHMPGAEVQRQRAAYVRGAFRTATVFSAVTVAVLSGLYAYDHAQRSKATEAAGRRSRYLTDMQLAHSSLERGDLGSALTLVEAHRNPPFGEDIRGFEWRLLWTLTHGELATLAQTPIPVTALAFGAAGAELTLGRGDGEVDVLDLRAGRPATSRSVRRLEAPPDGPLILSPPAVAAGGRLFAQASAPGMDPAVVQGWSLVVADSLRHPTTRRIAAGPGPIRAVAVAPTAGMVAVSGRGPAPGDPAEVRVWNTKSGRLVATLPAAGQTLDHVLFSPDERAVFAGGSAGVVYRWSLPGGVRREVFRGRPGRITGLSMARAAQRLAVMSQGGGPKQTYSCRVVDLGSSGRESRPWHVEGAAGTLALSPDGKTVGIGTLDGSLTLRDAVTGKETSHFFAHPDGLFAVAFSPDGKLAATAGADRKVKLWKVAGGAEVHLRGPSAPVRSLFLESDPLRVSSIRDGAVAAWDLDSRRSLAASSLGEGARAVLSNDGRHMVIYRRGELLVRSMSSGADRSIAIVSDPPRAMSFSADGRLWFTGEGSSRLRVWDSEGIELPAWTSTDRDLSFGIDSTGSLLALSGERSGVTVWDTARREKLAEFKTSSGGPVSVASDGSQVAWGVGSTVFLFEVATGRLNTLSGHVGPVGVLTFSPDGKTLASAGRDDYISLWSVVAAQQTIVIKSPSRGCRALAFSPDGHTLAGGFDDGLVKIWRASN